VTTKRYLTTEEAIAIMDEAMRTRAVNDETRTVWRLLRAELHRLEAILHALRKDAP
jgi:hypothetical protein